LKTVIKICLFILPILIVHSLQAQISPGDLSKAHAALEGMSNCTKCHEIGNKVPDQKCLDCHKEVTKLINQNRGFHVSKEVKSKTCVQCHNDHHGRKFEMIRFDEKNFNHNDAKYELEGRHQRINCRDCHKPDNITDSKIRKRSNTFLGLDKDCLTCHDDYHQSTLSDDCRSCHTNFEEFRPAKGFSHDDAAFKLKGAHREVDCKSCHKISTRNNREYQAFAGIQFKQCVACHQDEHNGQFGNNCTKCHNENSFLSLNNMNDFNHGQTRFPLIGRHVGVNCKLCHKGRFTAPVRHNACKDCHQDYHKEEFIDEGVSPDCKTCHSIEKPFTFTSYGMDEHNASGFVLEGAHLATPCFACHVSEDKWTFKSIGKECKNCHDNIHEGYISEKYYPDNTCSSCHNSGTWNEVNFDHKQTGWELKGKHAETTCRECHFTESPGDETYFQKFSLISTECNQCHNNIHGGQFVVEGKTDCNRCHSESGSWSADKFEHNQTRFPLEGKHADVACGSCHKAKLDESGDNQIEYKLKRYKCIDCHS
jgi:hypothetical protein